jgi:PIN like domain
LKKSKKPSGTKAEQLLETIEWHRDHFATDSITDEQIYEFIGPKAWVFLTCDRNIRYKPNEIDKLILCNIRAISLSKGDRTSADMAQVFITHKLDIGRALKKYRHPFIGYLQQKGLDIPESVLKRIELRRVELQSRIEDHEIDE